MIYQNRLSPRAVILTAAAVYSLVVPLGFTQQLPNETVIVTANASPVAFENLSRNVVVFNREDIDALPIRTITDILSHAVSVDVRSRAPYGMQSDLSIRGSAYSQVLVLVDGVRINDAQTGHHNSDLPVQLDNVDRIEVLLGSGSSIYGADALGGTINIITRNPDKKFNGSVSWGQHELAGGSFSTSFVKGGFKQSISASGERASGFQYDRGFRSVAVSSRTTLGEDSTFFVSYLDKEFGANGFYGPSPSKEWTNQTFISAERKIGGEAGKMAVVKGFYRTHGDRFLYDIRTPELYENRHRTHAAGVQLKTQFRLSNSGSLTFGGDWGRDWIFSNNLGDHSYSRTSLFTEFQWTPLKSTAVYPGLRFDYYSNFGTAVSPSLSGSWWVSPRVRLRSSVGHSFRIPTFTELYYQDPNNQATPDLDPESAWSADIGAEYIPADNWIGSLTVFARRERNVIDWIRFSDTEKWRTANIHRLHTAGFELTLERSFHSRGRLTAQYSYISTGKDALDFLSKYVLDYARHSWSTSAFVTLPFGLAYKQTLSYRRRSDGRDYWLLDGCLEKKFYTLVAAVDFTNLTDSRYQEVRGVDMPGRWFVVSVRAK